MSDVVLQARDLRKSFAAGKKTIQAVDGIDLEVERAEIFGFLGPNGAGKTTALRMPATLLPIEEGKAMVAGYDVRRKKVSEYLGTGLPCHAGPIESEYL